MTLSYLVISYYTHYYSSITLNFDSNKVMEEQNNTKIVTNTSSIKRLNVDLAIMFGNSDDLEMRKIWEALHILRRFQEDN